MSGCFCFRSDSRLVGAGEGGLYGLRPLDEHEQWSRALGGGALLPSRHTFAYPTQGTVGSREEALETPLLRGLSQASPPGCLQGCQLPDPELSLVPALLGTREGLSTHQPGEPEATSLRGKHFSISIPALTRHLQPPPQGHTQV